jgi:L-fuconolactonase
MMIDSHQHFWHFDPVEYPWIGEGKEALRRDFLPEDLEREIRGTGINGVVSVQARQSLDETWQLLNFSDRHEWIRGVVGWVPLVHPDLNRLLPTVASHPKLRGVRHILHDEADPFYMLREDFNHGIRALKPFKLVYDILIFERHLPQTIEFVDRHPNQVFVLDHLGKPRVRDGVISPWRENIESLAKRPNVYCKVSGLVTEADYTRWTDEQLRPYIDVVIDAFTPSRLMFGSDWPVCLVAASYRQWVDVVTRAISHLTDSERDRIWSGTAVDAYGLSR